MNMGIRQYILALLVFGMVQVTVATSHAAWVNDVHKTVNFQCPSGESIVYVYGMIIASEDDRIWQIDCAPRVTLGHCSWSGFSGWNKTDHRCSQNGALTGIRSFYITSKKDRRFSYLCCTVTISSPPCAVTKYINSLDKNLEYGVGGTNYVNGMTTTFDSTAKDRRWKMYECRYRY